MTQADTKTKLFPALIDPNDLPDLWPGISHMLEEACKWSAGQFDVKGVVEHIISGHFSLVVFFDEEKPVSLMVLTISQFTTGRRILEVLLASGSGMRDWMADEDKLLDMAKQYGCSAVRMIGREGLQKVLTTWKRTAVVLEREIV